MFLKQGEGCRSWGGGGGGGWAGEGTGEGRTGGEVDYCTCVLEAYKALFGRLRSVPQAGQADRSLVASKRLCIACIAVHSLAWLNSNTVQRCNAVQ